MDDAEYLFHQTARERKQAGRGDFCKKRRGGRRTRLPSDNLTKKQWKELNGKVITYDLSKPVQWREFKNWPDDNKAEYIRSIESKTGAGNKEMAEMMGIAEKTFSIKRKEWGCPGVKGQHTKLNREAWEAFCKGEAEPIQKIEPETPRETVRDPVKKDGAELNNIAILLKTLAGTGAKITIELTL